MIYIKVRYQQCLNMDHIGAFSTLSDKEEPQHIHVEREDRVAKFWLDPVRLQRNGGFSREEVSRIQKVILEHRELLREAWNEYFYG